MFISLSHLFLGPLNKTSLSRLWHDFRCTDGISSWKLTLCWIRHVTRAVDAGNLPPSMSSTLYKVCRLLFQPPLHENVKQSWLYTAVKVWRQQTSFISPCKRGSWVWVSYWPWVSLPRSTSLHFPLFHTLIACCWLFTRLFSIHCLSMQIWLPRLIGCIWKAFIFVYLSSNELRRRKCWPF